MEFPSQVVSKTYSIRFSNNFEPVLEPVLEPVHMNMRNEPFHDMACVVKRETPPKGGGYFMNSNIGKACQFQD